VPLPTRRALLAAALPPAPPRILFSSRGRTGVVNAAGTGLRFLEFDVPNQVSWQPVSVFPDRRRVILMSVENRETWKGTARSRIWIHDLVTGSLSPILEQDRLAPFYAPGPLLGGGNRLLVLPVIDGEQRLYSMNLDGTGAQAITKPGEGFTYGVSLSPDGQQVAFHCTGGKSKPRGYRVEACHLDGGNRRVLAGDEGELYFGTSWTPDGNWVLYQHCHPATDPGHDWSDLYLARAGGGSKRALTTGMRQWFATSYGDPKTRGGGSNMPRISPDGRWITYTRALPGSRTAWPFQPQRPDTDHFNRDYQPENARGGTEICLIDTKSGAIRQITDDDPPVWNFRTAWSPDGRSIAFCRAAVGEAPALWVMDKTGGKRRLITKGWNDEGADHPLWV